MTNLHWTKNIEDFTYWVASDFTAQIETRMERDEISNNMLAEAAQVSPSRISQVINDPGNLELNSAVKYARATGMKVALVVYDDADPSNDKGPISADVFRMCWERMERPRDFFDLEKMTPSRGCWVLTKMSSAVNDRTNVRDVKLENTAAANTYVASAGGGNGGRSA